MAYKRPRNPNGPFLLGAAILAFAVIGIVVVFTLLALGLYRKQQVQGYSQTYQVELAGGFRGDSLSVYVNDSLLMSRTLRTDSVVTLHCRRFSESSVLLVVDGRTDKISSFNLSPRGGRVVLRREDGIISATPVTR